MAVELVPFRWDDMDLMREPKVKTAAAGTVRFTIGGSGPRELDLSDEHLSQFRQLTDAWLAASRPVREGVTSRQYHGPSGTYFAGLRAWADQQGIKIEKSVAKDGRSAGFKYPASLRRRYDNWLAKQPVRGDQ